MQLMFNDNKWIWTIKETVSQDDYFLSLSILAVLSICMGW